MTTFFLITLTLVAVRWLISGLAELNRNRRRRKAWWRG